ncbi:glycoside hydrolase family protein [Enterococcus sp. BWB1-3]|uniref:lysozyme n=1 Tax=unclassified Enterococcus TaxID=2608891 RepID=UPI001921A350|nr:MULTISPECIES: lysozyme [unclassified Enterococcus]MBL1228213.1 glycoside hydrolase family protein [Enterococcus sp. BWB1-3]MCB5951950.1 lysozyme [Enterococcus sp. BWT-B8]MCB5954146.1 lysozyme [Enterococcus sp. CWB-B31]
MANENMKPSSKGRDLIKKWEALRLNAYQDSVGVWTIGYGHTKGVYAGLVITEAQANVFLDEDMQNHAVGIFNYVTVQLTQNQFDALVSFHFNLGVNILSGSQLLVYLNQKQWQSAAAEMKKYVYAGGQILEGLVNRRKDEVDLFLKEEPETTKGEITMQCFFRVTNESLVYYFDGKGLTPIGNPDEINILNDIYKANNGKAMPSFVLDKPWFVRLSDVAKRAVYK